MPRHWSPIAFATIAAAMAAVSGSGVRKLRMNEIQVLGTHNSYHMVPPERALEFLENIDKIAKSNWKESTEQTHSSLTFQLEQQNILQFELDVFHDPKGGLFSTPAGMTMDLTGLANYIDGSRTVTEKVVDGITTAAEAVAGFAKNAFQKIKGLFSRSADELHQPGFKVLHLQDFDFRTTCVTLVGCLSEIKRWQRQNPRHLPIHILLEAKDLEFEKKLKEILSPAVFDILVATKIISLTRALSIGKPELYALETEVLKVYDRESIITPDSIRGNYSTLQEAVLDGGWPYLDSVLGKVMFTLLSKRKEYIEDSPILANRLFFTRAPEGTPDAAVMVVDDPTLPQANAHAKKGYIVRVRSDTVVLSEATGWKEVALEGGAHMISTDYPEPQVADLNPHAVPYSVGFEPRCNPLLVDGDCPLFTHGGWTEWSTPPCPAACGKTANITAKRTCSNPLPTNGGRPCEGAEKETQSCSGPPCEAEEPGQWGPWSACQSNGSTCTVKRERNCRNNTSCAKVQFDSCECPADVADKQSPLPKEFGVDLKDGGGINKLGMGLGLATGVLTMLLAGAGFFVYRRREKDQQSTSMLGQTGSAIGPVACPHSTPEAGKQC